MKILKTLLLLPLLISCSPTYGDSYIVRIHPDFADKTQLILDAMSKWETAVGVSLTPIIEEPIHCTDPGNICVFVASEDFIIQKNGFASPDGGWTGVTHRDSRDYSSIYILDQILTPPPYDPITNPNPWYDAAATIPHELGHAFGLKHDPHKGAVMCSNVACGGVNISCWDQQQYFDLRGVDYYCN